MVDGEVSLVLPVGLAMDVDGSRRVLMNVRVVHLLNSRGRVRLHHLPALAVVQLHPVVLAILNLPSALERLGEELAQVVVIGGVLETEVANVAEILVELLCAGLALMKDIVCGRRTRKAVTEILDRGRLLLLPNLLVLLLVRCGLQTLPW
jgi:hypothetical protein